MPGTAGAWIASIDPGEAERDMRRRPDERLPFDPASLPASLPVMLDTNFYILRLQRRVPGDVLTLVEARPVVHSAVALAELTITLGMLDPGHPQTQGVRAPLQGLLDSIPMLECVSPGPAAWIEAGLLAGILARTHHGLTVPKTGLSAAEACCQRGRRRKLLNDALLFLSAREQGAILVSANIRDMDVLLRFKPDTRVLLFRQEKN